MPDQVRYDYHIFDLKDAVLRTWRVRYDRQFCCRQNCLKSTTWGGNFPCLLNAPRHLIMSQVQRVNYSCKGLCGKTLQLALREPLDGLILCYDTYNNSHSYLKALSYRIVGDRIELEDFKASVSLDGKTPVSILQIGDVVRVVAASTINRSCSIFDIKFDANLKVSNGFTELWSAEDSRMAYISEYDEVMWITSNFLIIQNYFRREIFAIDLLTGASALFNVYPYHRVFLEDKLLLIDQEERMVHGITYAALREVTNTSSVKLPGVTPLDVDFLGYFTANKRTVSLLRYTYVSFPISKSCSLMTSPYVSFPISKSCSLMTSHHPKLLFFANDDGTFTLIEDRTRLVQNIPYEPKVAISGRPVFVSNVSPSGTSSFCFVAALLPNTAESESPALHQ